jgi:hypothetical protein
MGMTEPQLLMVFAKGNTLKSNNLIVAKASAARLTVLRAVTAQRDLGAA